MGNDANRHRHFLGWFCAILIRHGRRNVSSIQFATLAAYLWV